ncbi:sigma-70 family RNA polymerase sigma factor [Dysgonomonas sp. Marseille-P4677]|uniref:RNA polymerase sigma factor n=1 Tax=Dysgonomonas sp. Marseille-P4677 TaxID=2364790 RepID=UPI0019126F2C|nr:sigma-70 family RNA polymerase sigma factor [Dysgonomonas sp. Marseille-P4677]MBK5722702.1 sigma-70 family RNA polymerase sigma factor [Dysgonomonas sp. Marseille-P4677]
MIGFDSGIIDQCRRGEHKAQMQLYTTFYKRVYNACYRVLRDNSEAEDAMQETFLKAFSALDNYDEKTPFEAWLVRIAINASIDKLRKKDMEFTNLNENIHYNVPDSDDDDWEQIMEQVGKVKTAIEKLPDSSRLIINLYLIEGYDHEEIADILNVAPGTVRVQYMRAKQKLIELI